jgi:uncharacterized protein YndB with AHSA1/START domain
MPEQITRSIIVKAPIAEVYRALADVESFPRFSEYIKMGARRGAHR